MDLQNMDLQGGSLQISTEVIAKIARCAALEVEGVAEVSCGTQNKKLKDLLEASTSRRWPWKCATARQTYAASDHGVRSTHPCSGGKGAENVKSAVPEHDQCHGEPCESGDRRSCCGAVRALAAVQKNG